MSGVAPTKEITDPTSQITGQMASIVISDSNPNSSQRLRPSSNENRLRQPAQFPDHYLTVNGRTARPRSNTTDDDRTPRPSTTESQTSTPVLLNRRVRSATRARTLTADSSRSHTSETGFNNAVEPRRARHANSQIETDSSAQHIDPVYIVTINETVAI